MNVAYFSNQFLDAKGHGIARYSRELYHALTSTDRALHIVPVAGWTSMKDTIFARTQAETGAVLTGLGRRGTSFAWTFLNYPKLENCISADVDVVHAVSLGYPIATRRPYIVTIHDLGPLTHPHFFTHNRPWLMKKSLEQANRRADAIVCVSQSTAEEVVTVLGSSVTDRISVVHEGVSEFFFSAPQEGDLGDLMLPEAPFILTAGAMSPRKNMGKLLEAFVKIVNDVPHDLVIVGGAGWDDSGLQKRLRETPMANRIHVLGFVSDLQLRALYARSDFYVHPSLYEGFGLPLLEAMAAGTPVLASNATSLPEVSGKAGALVDVTDVTTFADALLEMCHSDQTKRDMAELGLQRARQLNWRTAAKKMHDIYERVA